MPSTYSPILGIELIASGEQANTWGYTTNNNLGTLIEQAIAGQASIVMTTSSHTLTDLDGVSDEARCMILNVSGVLATTGTVVCPDATKVYVIANNTSGGHDIELKTTAGLGVIVPAGTVKQVFCDGTDVYESVTAIDTLLLGGDPTTDLEAVPRQYVDNNFLSLGGGTLTGALTLPGSPSAALEAATKGYADTKVSLTGGTLTGPLYLAANPTVALQAATKNYVDNAVTGGITGFVPDTRLVSTGTGLTGGGDLSIDRTLSLATSGVTAGSYTNPTVVVDAYGRITSATNGGASGVTSVTAAAPLSSSGGTTPQISFTGTLDIANGGTGSSTAAGALASLGGVAVGGALGTPSSGNLSNCTGYTYANLGGTVPTWNQNTTGTAAYATSPAGGGSFITSVNIGNQSVANASSLGNFAATDYLKKSEASSTYLAKAGGAITGTITGTLTGQAINVTSTALNAIVGTTNNASAGGVAWFGAGGAAGYGGYQGYGLYTNNSIYASGSTFPSDIRLKEDDAPITNALETVNKLRPVSFNWKAETAKGIQKGGPVPDYGFIAQEIELVIDNVVSEVQSPTPVEVTDAPTRPNILEEQLGSHKALDYTKLIPFLTAAIQELSAEVEALKAKVK